MLQDEHDSSNAPLGTIAAADIPLKPSTRGHLPDGNGPARQATPSTFVELWGAELCNALAKRGARMHAIALQLKTNVLGRRLEAGKDCTPD